MRDKYDDHRDIMAVCHDIAPDYRPHHTTTAFWEGVDDARWGRTDMARKRAHDAYCAGVETFIRALTMVDDKEETRWDCDTAAEVDKSS